MRASKVPGISVKKSSTGISRVPVELCVLIISHFLAFSWTCLSNFLDYVDKDTGIHKYMFKNIGVSVLHKVKKSGQNINKDRVFFLGGLGEHHPAKILRIPPHPTLVPVFGPKLVPPQPRFVPENLKNLNTFLCQI